MNGLLASPRMRRIVPPEWAEPPRVEVEADFGEEEYGRVQQAQDQWAPALQQQVQVYVDEVAGDGNAEFPDPTRLSGEYYVAEERYYVFQERRRGAPGEPEPRVSFLIHCLERPRFDEIADRDYLGLEIYFRWRPAEGRIEPLGDIDTRSI